MNVARGFSPVRRRALGFGLAMGAGAALAVWGKPSQHLADERARESLEALFPERFAGWQVEAHAGQLVRPSEGGGKAYGLYDQVLERVYLGAQGERVMLSVAYGREQSAGLQVHRPEVCYRGGGFEIGPVRLARLALDDRRLPVRQLHAIQPGRSEPITYWTVLGDRAVEEWGQFRFQQIAAGLRGQILDGMLVRVSSIDHDSARAWATHERFAQDLAHALAPQHVARVLGVVEPF